MSLGMDLKKHQQALQIVKFLQKYISEMDDVYGENKDKYAKCLFLMKEGFSILFDSLENKKECKDENLLSLEKVVKEIKKEHIN